MDCFRPWFFFFVNNKWSCRLWGSLKMVWIHLLIVVCYVHVWTGSLLSRLNGESLATLAARICVRPLGLFVALVSPPPTSPSASVNQVIINGILWSNPLAPRNEKIKKSALLLHLASRCKATLHSFGTEVPFFRSPFSFGAEIISFWLRYD